MKVKNHSSSFSLLPIITRVCGPHTHATFEAVTLKLLHQDIFSAVLCFAHNWWPQQKMMSHGRSHGDSCELSLLSFQEASLSTTTVTLLTGMSRTDPEVILQNQPTTRVCQSVYRTVVQLESTRTNGTSSRSELSAIYSAYYQVFQIHLKIL